MLFQRKIVDKSTTAITKSKFPLIQMDTKFREIQQLTLLPNILSCSVVQRIAIIHYSGTGNKLQQLVNFSFNCNVMPGLSSENSRLLRVFEYVINYRSLLQFFPIFSQFGFREPTTTSCRRRCRFSPSNVGLRRICQF